MRSEKMIRSLYDKVIQEMENTDELNEKLKKELLKLLEVDEKQKDEYEHYRDMLFRAASIAEENGFVRGFRYAFQLFMECMEDEK